MVSCCVVSTEITPSAVNKPPPSTSVQPENLITVSGVIVRSVLVPGPGASSPAYISAPRNIRLCDYPPLNRSRCLWGDTLRRRRRSTKAAGNRHDGDEQAFYDANRAWRNRAGSSLRSEPALADRVRCGVGIFTGRAGPRAAKKRHLNRHSDIMCIIGNMQ